MGADGRGVRKWRMGSHSENLVEPGGRRKGKRSWWTGGCIPHKTHAEVGVILFSPSYYFVYSAPRVTSTIYSADARYVLSGSDDGNVRIWKAKASDKLGVITARERASMEYRQSLVKRWSVDKDVGRVLRYVG